MLPGVTENTFETECFDGAVWRFNYCEGTTPRQVASAAMAEQVKLVACRVPADSDPAVGLALEATGFRLIDQLVTLRRQVLPLPAAAGDISPAGEADRDACVAIATAALRHDRHHADSRIDHRIADKIKAAWVSNNLAGRAELTLVARNTDGRIVGFNQLLRTGSEAVIDLIAVAPFAQRQGWGRALVAAGLTAYAATAESMRVGTQRSNLASLGLYQSLGFIVSHEHRTYHLTPDFAPT